VNKRVTIIEDSKETQRQFLDSLPESEIVEMQAIMVEPFFNDEIEIAVKEFGPRLIILDLRLDRSEESGFRILRKLRQSSLKDIPVIVCSKYITSSANDENKKKALRYGAVAALPKFPFPKIQTFFDVVDKNQRERGTSQSETSEEKPTKEEKS